MPQSGQRQSVARASLLAFGLALAAGQIACSETGRSPGSPPPPPSPVDGGPAVSPEAALGERLFRETRFAQYFAARAEGDMNRRLTEGDPTVASVATPAGPVEGPYRGQSINCAGCHLSDELVAQNRAYRRAFADFSRRSPLPARADGRETTTRNAASLTEAVQAGAPTQLLHHDGEHASAADLVQASLTGRNFGWLPGERAQAVAHIANVLRRDEGGDALAARFGGLSYRLAFAGASSIDVVSTTDEQLLAAVGRVMAGYIADQRLSRDAVGHHDGSPYDRFLRKNDLPAAPAAGETEKDYGRRLYTQVASLKTPSFVTAADGQLAFSDQPFVFGPTELAGLLTFLGKPGETPTGPPGIWACSTCHPPPHFTDFSFHNTGVTEFEYDGIHGAGSFAALAVPSLAERRQDEAAFLPASPRLPAATSVFRAVPAKEHPGRTDLGLWNVLLNEDAPAVQPALQGLLCPLVADAQGSCNPEQLLALGIASFKSRGLRNLGQSGPYFHNGMADTLEDVVNHYLRASQAVKDTQLRNGDTALEWLSLGPADVPPLAAFLRSLNGH